MAGIRPRPRGDRGPDLVRFPLLLGALDLGVVELYRLTPGELSRTDYATAVVLVGRTAWAVLRKIAANQQEPETDSTRQRAPLSRWEIHQATGMVLVQAGTNATEALLLLQAHAFAQDRTLRAVARSVVNRD